MLMMYINTKVMNKEKEKGPQRRWHVLRDNAGGALPYRILFLDTETEAVETTPDKELHRMTLGWSCYARRRNKEDTTFMEDWKEWTDDYSLLEYIEGLCYDKKTLYIVGSNVMFDLQVIGFFDYFQKREWKLTFVYSGGMSFILSIHNGRQRIKCLSSQNFAPYSVKQVGEYIGKPKLDVDFQADSAEKISTYCRRDTEIVRDFMYKYLDFLRQNDCGNFRMTRAAQALGFYRHRFLDHPVEIHTHEKASDLEQDSYYGGMTECFHIGEYSGEDFLYVDVNSMYPFVMRQKQYPIKLVNYVSSGSLEYIKKKIDRYCFTASVKIRTDRPRYPARFNQRTIFPVGEFLATLSTPELKEAIKRGEIKEVYEFAMYRKAPIFRSYIDTVYDLKKKYDQKGKKLWYNLTKVFMNSLYGKFGQNVPVCIEDEEVQTDEVYRVDYFDYDLDEYVIRQQFFNRRQVFQGKQPGRDSFFAIPAHVTAHARMYLWALIDLVGRDNVYYCDTDSLIFPARYKDRLDGFYDQYDLGKVEIEKRADHIEIYGPKDYVFGDDIRRKGIRKDAVEVEPLTFRQKVFPSLYTVIKEGHRVGFPIKTVEKTLKREYTKGEVLDSGKVEPIRLDDDSYNLELFA